MFVFVCLWMLFAAGRGDFVWRNCETDPNDTAITVNDFSLQPSPVTFPGHINLDLDLNVTRNISRPLLNVELYRVEFLGAQMIPCIGNTHIGTCRNIDPCELLDTIINGSSVISKEVGIQVRDMLSAALGHESVCPIKEDHVTMRNKTIKVEDFPRILNSLTNGPYRIIIRVKEDPDPASTQTLGCLQFDADLKRGPIGGFLFNGGDMYKRFRAP